MLSKILQWIVPFFLFLSFDLIWFKIYGIKNIYNPVFQKINKKKIFRMWSAIMTWIILSISVSLFLTYHSYRRKINYFLSGCLIGFIIYSIYNLTNYSTIEKYTLKMTILDTIWGTLLYGFILWICSNFSDKVSDK
jgi:uncharacterized membrane protein